MKVTTLLLFACSLQLLATSTKAQSAVINLNENQLSLGQLISEIERQTEYLVVYSAKEIDTNKSVQLKAKSSKVSTYLQEALSNTDVAYEFENDYIILSKKNADLQQSDNKKISGRITDQYGEAIIGASVVVKGSTIGTVTDIDGRFALEVDSEATIKVSYMGFIFAELSVGEKTLFDISLQEDTQLLDEVVVVGYGTQKKTNLTGAVSMVNAERLESRPVQNISQALQGVVPGLNFSTNSGGGTLDNALEFNIRGAGSIGDGSSSSPLVLIDGVEGNMNAINPQDIQSISVLKDAASASIYGSRAAFGVILITTKSGVSDKTSVSYTGSMRFTKALAVPEMMDSYTFARYFNEADRNSKNSSTFTPDIMNLIQQYQKGEIKTSTSARTGGWDSYYKSWADTDWFKEMYRDWAPTQEHNISVSSGTEKMTYLISANVLDQNGLIRHGTDNFKRYSLNGKISAKLNKYTTLGYSTKFIREDYERPSYMTGLFFHNIARRWPTLPVYDPNGYYFEGTEIIQMRDGGIQRNEKDYLYQHLDIVFEPINDWKIYANANINTIAKNEHYDKLPIFAHDDQGNPYSANWSGGDAGKSGVSENAYKENFMTSNIYTDYFKQVGDHFFKAMMGFNAELMKTRNVYGVQEGLISPNIPTLNTSTINGKTSGGYAEWATAGFFGRLNYNYKERYMLEVNMRYDGTSRFIGDKRWGMFPSFSGGWNIAKENFFGDLSSSISTLKVRGSWGQLGNMNTKAWYPFYQGMNVGTSNGSWLIDNNRPNTAYSPGLVNTRMTWERVESWNIGLDWAALNNRLTGSFDYFKRTTKDMIGPAPELGAVLGTSVPKVNNADMESYGFELELGWRDRIAEVAYGVKLVLSDAQQKITRYPNDTKSNPSGTWYSGKMNGEIWGYTTLGIAKSDAEMNAYLANVSQSRLGDEWAAGDIMYADLNGDKEISNGDNTVSNPGDLSIIGNRTPRYNFGVSLDASWKGFDVSVFFQGIGKRDYAIGGAYFWGVSGGMWSSAGFNEHWDFFRSEDNPLGANVNSYYPRPLFDRDQNQQTQTLYLQNAAYLRLKNLQIGYSLPKSVIGKVGIQSTRIYFSGENLLTFTSLSSIFDPETIDGSWGEGKVYPLSKTLSVGLNINF